jgi:hypothetical protein
LGDSIGGLFCGGSFLFAGLSVTKTSEIRFCSVIDRLVNTFGVRRIGYFNIRALPRLD